MATLSFFWLYHGRKIETIGSGPAAEALFDIMVAIPEDCDGTEYEEDQDIKLKNMERSTMEMLAAIPEEYDGSKYQQNLHQLKKDVDSLLSEESRIE